MGGLRHKMPTTFATYAIGMMALAGVPVLFSGFWSKDEVLHAASAWPYSKVPFVLGLVGAFLTAFYMTRQMVYVFFGQSRLKKEAHESPQVMTVPLVILAAFAVLIGFIGTPAWPWLHSYLTYEDANGGIDGLCQSGVPLPQQIEHRIRVLWIVMEYCELPHASLACRFNNSLNGTVPPSGAAWILLGCVLAVGDQQVGPADKVAVFAG